MLSRAMSFIITVSIVCTACAGSINQRSEWDDIDYSKVYRKARERQIDQAYEMPSVVGCVDDDLYKCY